ncbi:hypothetical protein R1flu_000112 [Riccia fluitans]|uniref:Uncharacterized protein n=1 Tax=Riccia fluitans TaxID=41844 RepID=A0ABD1Y2N4_9MARC
MAPDAEALLPRHENEPRGEGDGSKWLIAGLIAALLLVGSHDLLRDTGSSGTLETNSEKARDLEKLKQPLVILISYDGFRWGYTEKVPTPNIDSLVAEGTSAAKGLIPVYPSATFPNHYSIVTGLYPAWHGIIQNQFSDPVTGKIFKRGNNDPEWWLGEPLWWVDLPDGERPSLITLYIGSPDAEGHNAGPDSPEVSAAITRVDSLLGRLVEGLKARRIYKDVTTILLGDHGMVQTCESKHIYVEDFAPWINISVSWVDIVGTQLSIRPPADVSIQEVYDKMVEALSSRKIRNGEHLQVYLREDLPERLHYSTGRVQPIIGLVDESYNVAMTRNDVWCGGVHGYDNAYQSMRSIFIARGPKIAKNRRVPSFENVQVYNFISNILNLENPAPNNGTLGFLSSVLLPSS